MYSPVNNASKMISANDSYHVFIVAFYHVRIFFACFLMCRIETRAGDDYTVIKTLSDKEEGVNYSTNNESI